MNFPAWSIEPISYTFVNNPVGFYLKILLTKVQHLRSERPLQTNVNFDTDNFMRLDRHYLCDRS
ncbi:MAG: hypothetical protein ICV52_06065 [Microcoleus sp. C1-bin4]|nr:hypothetical protein [Microcoleus sp. C1-bin4]